MATLTGPWETGENLTAITIIGQTWAGTTLTPGTSVSLLGVIRQVRHSTRGQFRHIGPSTSRQENMVKIMSGNYCELLVLKLSTAAHLLRTLVQTYEYVNITYTESANAWDGMYRIGDYTNDYADENEQYEGVALLPVKLTDRAQVTVTTPP